MDTHYQYETISDMIGTKFNKKKSITREDNPKEKMERKT
jgi:hypothetical protein